jgi:hypothetical protein
LSINIETTAVKVHRISKSFQRFPLLALLAFIPTHWKIPDSARIATIIIIPSRRPMV